MNECQRAVKMKRMRERMEKQIQMHDRIMRKIARLVSPDELERIVLGPQRKK